MNDKTRNIATLLGKAILAAALLTSLLGVAASHIAPAMPLVKVLTYAFGLFLVLVVLTVLSLTFSQFILRNGGTDAQWFWFSSEPKGLVQLREQAVHRKDSV
ncbi:MAG: hypothetical protein CFE44_04405 [Burkholderiales bacterium PBB4]|nr:MAG: hypothetical protein CFE44_04405 [Burkholderiales bacterium PBB4]